MREGDVGAGRRDRLVDAWLDRAEGVGHPRVRAVVGAAREDRVGRGRADRERALELVRVGDPGEVGLEHFVDLGDAGWLQRNERGVRGGGGRERRVGAAIPRDARVRLVVPFDGICRVVHRDVYHCELAHHRQRGAVRYGHGVLVPADDCLTAHGPASKLLLVEIDLVGLDRISADPEHERCYHQQTLDIRHACSPFLFSRSNSSATWDVAGGLGLTVCEEGGGGRGCEGGEVSPGHDSPTRPRSRTTARHPHARARRRGSPAWPAPIRPGPQYS